MNAKEIVHENPLHPILCEINNYLYLINVHYIIYLKFGDLVDTSVGHCVSYHSHYALKIRENHVPMDGVRLLSSS